MPWYQHAAAGKLQLRKYPDNWAGAAAASPTNRPLLPRRQMVPKVCAWPPARHWEGWHRGCQAQGCSPEPSSCSWAPPVYTCNTGHTKTWFGIPVCFCKSYNKTCICKSSCSYRLIPPQHHQVMLIIYIILYYIYIKWLTDYRPKILRLTYTPLMLHQPLLFRATGALFCQWLWLKDS